MTIVGDASKARFIAAIIDNIIAMGIMFGVVMLIPENLPAIKGILIGLVYLGYFVVLESLWSRTLGKYFQGLVVRKLDGGPSNWKTAIIRGSLRILEVNPLLFGGIPAGLLVISSERKQRIGDMLAGTVVVSDKLKWDANEDQPSVE